jgi:hypothetical protein
VKRLNQLNNLILNNMSNLINFRNAIINNGGASYNLLNGEFNPDNGYMVSIKDHEQVSRFNTLNLQHEIARYIRSKADILISGLSEDKFIGAWIEDDNLVLDVSIKVNSLDDALQIGKENEQRAIFDCNNSVTINL